MTATSTATIDLIYDNLAFTCPKPTPTTEDGKSSPLGIGGGGYDTTFIADELVVSVGRAPFVFDEDTTLNVELFGDSLWDHILCFVPGVCESAETWTVQNLARICQRNKWQLAVLELEGHGLSSTIRGRGVLSGDMDRLVRQVISFCRHVVVEVYPKRRKQHQQPNITSTSTVSFAVSGFSLGGALAAYASQRISNDIVVAPTSTSTWTKNTKFVGCLLLSPSVGVDPAVVPSNGIVFALAAISMIVPWAAFMTPIEDPSHYSCPPWSKRNYEGPWPLGTARLLLDITSKIVPMDVQEGNLNLNHVPDVVVVAGSRDPVVPIGAIRTYMDGLTLLDAKKELIEIVKGDHGLLAQSPKSKVTAETLERLQQSFFDKHVH
jgi:alpha-beta hydrolase superfamily lysophospholipase